MRRRYSMRAVLTLVLAATLLSACSPIPYRTRIPKSVERQFKDLEKSHQTAGNGASYPFALCYGKLVNTPDEVLSEAQYVCKDGAARLIETDRFWTSCSLQQPVRATFICTPAQKAGAE